MCRTSNLLSALFKRHVFCFVLSVVDRIKDSVCVCFEFCFCILAFRIELVSGCLRLFFHIYGFLEFALMLRYFASTFCSSLMF